MKIFKKFGSRIFENPDFRHRVNSALGLVRKEIKKYRKPIILGGFLIFIVALMVLPLPFFMGVIIDDFLPRRQLSLLLSSVLILFLLNIICVCVKYLQQILFFKLNNKIAIDIRIKLFEKISSLPLLIKEKYSTGYIMSRIKDDPQRLTALFGEKILNLAKQFFILLVSLVAVFFINWRLALIALAITPVFLYTVHYFGKRIKKQSEITFEKVAQSSKSLQENIDMLELCKLCNREKFSIRRYIRVVLQAFRSFVSLKKLEVLNSSILGFLGAVLPLSILAYGGYEIVNGFFTIGKLMAFITILGYIVGPATSLISFNIEIQKLFVALSRVGEILVLPEEKRYSRVKFDRVHSLQLEDLGFSYNNAARAIENITFNITQGKKMGIVGHSGAGKSTLSKILSGLYDFSGKIIINNNRLRCEDKRAIREKVAVVPQEPFLFNDTIFRNVAIGKRNANEDEVRNALKKARAWEFIGKLKDKEWTYLGERGNRFSAGQKQRIAIARAFIKGTDILILDEATSNLDKVSEKYINEAIDEISGEMIVIMISHNLENVRNSDAILVIDQGRIVEQGTHAQLLRRKGYYMKLHQAV